MSWQIMNSYADYVYQLHMLRRSPLYWGSEAPRGTGEPVLLIPGFLTGDWSLGTLGRWLTRLGYDVYYSGIDWNINCPQKTALLLRQRLDYIVGKTHQPVTIIGHSLGGVLARFFAGSAPAYLQQVITLGSPIDGSVRIHPLVPLTFQLIQRVQNFFQQPLPHCAKDLQCMCDFRKGAFAALPSDVRFTAIYSKQDEIVDWRACIDPTKLSYEVRGQHLGLIVNTEVYRLLGQLLVTRTLAGSDTGGEEIPADGVDAFSLPVPAAA